MNTNDRPAKSVFTPPGSTIFTRIPSIDSSKWTASEMPSTAHFDPWYSEPSGYAMRPPTDEMLTMTPLRWDRIVGRTARMVSTRPNTLTSNWRRSVSIGVASSGPYAP